jgi:hypothetical protein
VGYDKFGQEREEIEKEFYLGNSLEVEDEEEV